VEAHPVAAGVAAVAAAGSREENVCKEKAQGLRYRAQGKNNKIKVN
jgi:hypothetical protein